MRCEAKPRFSSNISASLRSEILAENRRIHCRRRRSASRTQRRRETDGDAVRKGGNPATPLLTWKIDGGGREPKVRETHRTRESDSDDNGGGGRKRRGHQHGGNVSVRRLAAGLWRLQPLVALASSRGRVPDLPGAFKALIGPFPHHSNGAEFGSGTRVRQLHSPALVHHTAKDGFHKVREHEDKHESSVALLNPAMEQATKWDPRRSETKDEIYSRYSHLRSLEDRSETASSVISVLQSELDLTRLRVYELEAEQRSSKKKLDHFLKKLREEKVAWRSREHEKVRLVIDGVKDDLNRERKHRQRLEVMNTKLVDELADAKLTTKRLMQDYEKERKSRELLEEVCDELAKEIAEERAEIESLKNESMKIREDLEEERRMLQMAEVWREERLQMKLVDAKVALEEKYSHLNKLQEQLEAFLRFKTTTNSRELKEAGLLNEALNSAKVQEVKEFLYQPPASEDGFSAFGDVHSGETNEKEIETCFGRQPDTAGYSPMSRNSKIHVVKSKSPDDLHESYLQVYTRSSDQNGSLGEDESVWESESEGDEPGSSNSLDGSDPSVHGHHHVSNHLQNGTEWEADAGDITNPDNHVPYTVSEQLKKSSSVSRLWLTFPGKVHYFKNVIGDVTKGRVSDFVASPDRASSHGVVTPGSIGHWSSPDAGNPHMARARKGWIHWPKGFQRNSFKEKLFEAGVDCQKIQLRQVLKEKI